MVSLFKQDKIKTFEYLYFFVMVVYMGQMVHDTTRMVSGFSSPLFPLLFPMILTIVLLDRHKVKFDDKRLIRILLIFAVWTVLLFAHKHTYGRSQYSYYFFLFYSIVIAYIHVQVFGKKMLLLYEHIMIRLSLLSLVLWGIYIIFPGTASFFRGFPEAANGNHIFYIYKWFDPSRLSKLDGFVIYGLLRNSGCSWEPGRFAVMVLLALFCNLTRNGIKFKGNWGGIILLLALASTMSTTGYLGAIVLYSFFALKKISLKRILAFSLIIVPIVFQLAKLEFMQEKIESQLDLNTELRKANEVMDYVNKIDRTNEYVSALGRFQAMYFELINIQKDPILGYGRNPGKSYFRQRISANFSLPEGLFKTIGEHGIPLGILLYILLYKSSVALGREFKIRKGTLFVTYLIFLSSYDLFTTPIFTAFWLYGLFKKEDELTSVKEEANAITEELNTEVVTLENKV